jgi:hypothetical protein
VKLFAVDVLEKILDIKDFAFFEETLKKKIEKLIENEKDKTVSDKFLKFL